MKTDVKWVDGTAFEGVTETGGRMEFDGSPDHSGRGQSPMEALLCSLAACTAIDVISILKKKQQVVTAYRLEVTGERQPSGVWPRPFTKITVRHLLKGVNLDPLAVARAVQLSDEKYCSVSATLREGPELASEWAVE